MVIMEMFPEVGVWLLLEVWPLLEPNRNTKQESNSACLHRTYLYAGSERLLPGYFVDGLTMP